MQYLEYIKSKLCGLNYQELPYEDPESFAVSIYTDLSEEIGFLRYTFRDNANFFAYSCRSSHVSMIEDADDVYVSNIFWNEDITKENIDKIFDILYKSTPIVEENKILPLEILNRIRHSEIQSLEKIKIGDVV